ncbi:hypothetical protein [Microbulbifer discodermiae]|uniref:hypothetical protein n=1 Tax=Microbulbifer sp. 2201CG32-9 TaxID=3232309 RepID=UPI00345B653B
MLTSLTEKMTATVLGAALIGGGGAVLKNWYHNGVQDERIAFLEEAQDDQKELMETLQETNTTIAVLNERLKWLEKETRDE